jgi:hypothetical protein
LTIEHASCPTVKAVQKNTSPCFWLEAWHSKLDVQFETLSLRSKTRSQRARQNFYTSMNNESKWLKCGGGDGSAAWRITVARLPRSSVSDASLKAK